MVRVPLGLESVKAFSFAMNCFPQSEETLATERYFLIELNANRKDQVLTWWDIALD
jgi:hypothetical protein